MEQIENNVAKTQSADNEIDLLALFGALLDARWTIIACTLVAATTAILIATISTPVYQAGAMLQVEEKAASLPGLEDLSEAFGSESSTQAELEIIKSRSVVGTAVDNLNLTTKVTPVYFPYIGDYLARGFSPSDEQPFRSPFLGLSSYAWGGEQIQVDRFDVSRAYADQVFTIKATGSGEYTLSNESGKTWSGDTGKILSTDNFEIFVSTLEARSGTQFEVEKRSWLKVVQDIGSSLSVSEAGRQSGIIRISYRDIDADRAELITDEIARVYVDQNIRRLSAEA